MNLFEQELELMFGDKIDSEYIINDKTLLFKTNNGLRIKITFGNSHIQGKYDELVLSIKNLTDGTIDKETFNFGKIWGIKRIRSDFDVLPYIWTYCKTEWYAYIPTQEERDELANKILDYVEMYE